MQKAFHILKGKPTITVRLTRDSVCAGDDCDAPHEEYREINSFVDAEVLASNLSSGYLPSVSGDSHTWNFFLNDQLIAIIKTDSIVTKISKVDYAETNHIHFKYNSST